MYSCDFCKKDATINHKIACERCYNLLLHLLTAFEAVKQTKPSKRLAKKRVKKVSKGKVKPEKREIETKSKEKTARELQFEKATSETPDSTDPLTKCATCEFSFLNEKTKRIECVDGKDPKTCEK